MDDEQPTRRSQWMWSLKWLTVGLAIIGVFVLIWSFLHYLNNALMNDPAHSGQFPSGYFATYHPSQPGR